MAFRKWLLHGKTFYTLSSGFEILQGEKVSGSYELSLDTALTAVTSRAFLKQKQTIMQKISSIIGPSFHLLLSPIRTSKELPFHYMCILEFHWAKAHNLLYVVFEMPGLFSSIMRWPTMEIKAKQALPPHPIPCVKGRMGGWHEDSEYVRKTWHLMIFSLSLLSSLLATLKWGDVIWSPAAARTGCWGQQGSGSTEKGWPLLQESPQAESCCSAPEHSQIVCVVRKEFKTLGRKGAVAMWENDKQGQQAKGLSLCEQREYIVSKVRLKAESSQTFTCKQVTHGIITREAHKASL